MADTKIPGVSGTYDKYIEALMKVERIPRDNAAKELDSYKMQQSAWRQVYRYSNDFKTTAKDLYSYNNPFAEKTAISSNENAITATTTRDAKEQAFKVKVHQLAESDSFLSAEIEKNANVPKGTYTFVVGDKTISFNWKGGTYKSFMEVVNNRGKGV